MADLARAFKADPGAIAWDAGARGGPAHLLAAYLAKTVGADPSKVRLAASPQEATAGIAKLRDLSGPLKAGRVRALAVTSPAATAGIASLKEQGINLVFANWHGLLAGPGLKPSQRDELLSKVKAATATPAWKAFLEDEGWTPVWLQGSDYARFLDEESRSLGYLAKPLGLRPRR
jgi:putative tricarboxylic transport membrane protein